MKFKKFLSTALSLSILLSSTFNNIQADNQTDFPDDFGNEITEYRTDFSQIQISKSKMSWGINSDALRNYDGDYTHVREDSGSGERTHLGHFLRLNDVLYGYKTKYIKVTLLEQNRITNFNHLYFKIPDSIDNNSKGIMYHKNFDRLVNSSRIDENDDYRIFCVVDVRNDKNQILGEFHTNITDSQDRTSCVYHARLDLINKKIDFDIARFGERESNSNEYSRIIVSGNHVRFKSKRTYEDKIFGPHLTSIIKKRVSR